MQGGIARKWLVAIIIVCAAVAAAQPARIIYVDPRGEPQHTGSSWAKACCHLQDALALAAVAAKPVEIRIALGTYRPDKGSGNQAASFRLLNGVTLKGGYAGSAEPDPNARDISLYETILNGDLLANNADDPKKGRDDSCHVVTASFVDHTAVMDGLTITGGAWTSYTCRNSPVRDKGASLYIDQGNPTIRDCRFAGNRGGERVAVVYAFNGSAPTFTGCVFTDNQIGMEAAASCPTLLNCLFMGNKEVGIACDTNSVASLTDCRFESNGTGIRVSEGTTLVLAACTLVDDGTGVDGESGAMNAADCVFERNGSAVEMLGAALTLTDCRFEGNKKAVGSAGDMAAVRCSFTGNSGGLAGAISADSLVASRCTFTANTGLVAGAIASGGVLTLRDCEFSGNSGGNGAGAVNASRDVLKATGSLFTGNFGKSAGAIYSHAAVFSLSNCTFADNRGTPVSVHHGRPGPACPATMTQCILWDGPASVQQSSSHGPIITYSDIEGGYEGQGNIDADPCFVAPGYWADPNDPSVVRGPEASNAVWVPGDYHLKSQAGHWDRATETWVCDEVTSVCIDAGDPNGAVGLEPFPNGGFVNMGAYGGADEASRTYFGGPICETQIAGDINGDCVVDEMDREILTSHWLMQGWPVTDLPPTVVVTQPKDGDEFDAVTPVEIRADAADPDGSVIRVAFRVEYPLTSGAFRTGMSDVDPSDGWGCMWRWSGLPGKEASQTWTISAEAMDDDGNVTVSSEIKLKIRVVK